MGRDVRVAGWVALTSVDDVPDDYVYWLDDNLALPITPGHDDTPGAGRDIAPVRHKAPGRALASREWSGGTVPEAFRVRAHRGSTVPLRAVGLAAVALAVPAIIYGASGSPEPTALRVPPPAYVTLVPAPPEQSTVVAPVVAVGERQRAAPAPDDDPTLPPTSGVARPAHPPATRPIAPPKTTPPAAAPLRVTREAEASGNIDRGSVAPRRLASGGVVMGWIGYGRANTLTVTGLRVPAAGRHRVTVHYVTAEWRRASVRVNSGTWLVVDFPSTGGWDSVGTVTVEVPLAAGDNTLEFGNSHYWAPDLDRVVVTR